MIYFTDNFFQEEQRINAQCEQLGEAGLAEKAKLLESAIDENTV